MKNLTLTESIHANGRDTTYRILEDGVAIHAWHEDRPRGYVEAHLYRHDLGPQFTTYTVKCSTFWSLSVCDEVYGIARLAQENTND